ncbi:MULTISPECIES: hypothetical protein [unclassified Sphingopyxis]|uniref:hypothetical protein n=1 Tax=unclassified Sphingopyxis TaxID=2614943 RepID=UPI000736CD2D|nr:MULTISPECIES: hypothetical protein [unclassified Sphingopyxis]KTE29502.1 hypothetical protein ATE62_20945 [Sphingopyxis sp. HIX]KTE79283.1 hypothetical protein ATE72_19100 [Sphingopyxis sp. HXXIV]
MEYIFEVLKIIALALLLSHDSLRLPRNLRNARRSGRVVGTRRSALWVLLMMSVAPVIYHGLELVHCLATVA